MEGRTTVTGRSPASLQQGPFTQGLRVGVGVRPAERLRPGLAELDHMVLGPVDSQLLRPLGQEGHAGGPQLGSSGGPQAGQLLGVTAGRLGVRAGASGGLDLVAPRRPWRRRASRTEGLGRRASPPAGHVGGRNGDQVGERLRGRIAGRLLQDGSHAGRPEKVDLYGGVEGGVETDGGGGVHDRRAGRQQLGGHHRRGRDRPL